MLGIFKKQQGDQCGSCWAFWALTVGHGKHQRALSRIILTAVLKTEHDKSITESRKITGKLKQ